MSLHYLGKYVCWKIATWHCATSRASNTSFHSTGSMATKQSRPQSSGLQDNGASSRSESTSHGCTVSTNWSSVCFMFGMSWTKASLTEQLVNGVCVFVLMCAQRVDTTSTCCDIISMPIYTTMWHETFYVVLNMIWFLRLTSVIRGKFELLTFPR